MAKSKPLVIVESPTKVKTINKILGNRFKVVSSMGHLIDLPKSSLGVDIEHDFEPKLIVMRSKQKILSKLKKEAQKKKVIYIATDPDREGEAIGWNIVSHIGEGKDIYRVTFQEITKDAVQKAFEHPRKFDSKKVKAQLARRVLDRIVGYKISPLLWKKVGSRLSAGRVQSVALRLIVEREREIGAFVPKEYWQIAADLQKSGRTDVLTAALDKRGEEKINGLTQSAAEAIVQQVQQEQFIVKEITRKEIRRNPLAPYITSTLQQDAFYKLGFHSSKTMQVAQQLYEGIEIGNEEAVGLITYMRTDSVNISQEAMEGVRKFIHRVYGDDYLPDQPNRYKSKKSAQEAHEAIRPTHVFRRPDEIKQYLDKDQFLLYDLIWRRFVGSQMTPAVFENKRLDIQAGSYLFGASGSTLLFDGFLSQRLENQQDDNNVDLTHYQKGDQLQLLELKPTQHFTKPPPRYSEATLIKTLEEDGIGRPSTYASIILTLVRRNYVLREKGYFTATELGMKICDLLVEYFANIMDVGFTAQMEENLDLIEEGRQDYAQLLQEFYRPFREELRHASQKIKKTQNFVDQYCPQCGRQMVIKWGRRGKFLSCSGFPKCKHAQAITTEVPCPQEGCGGKLVQRRSRGGRSFYGCTNFPACTFTTNQLPKDPAPQADKADS